jgi:exodeoxyribonuclease VIII
MKPGIYEDISFEDYRKIEAVNASYLADINISPSHAQQIKSRGYTTKTLEFGSAVHCAVLEPEKFNDEYVVFEGATRGGKVWDAFKEANAGKNIVKKNELYEITDLSGAIIKHPLAKELLERPGLSEVTIIWEEPKTGILCKSRLDRYSTNLLIDLKTTRSIAPFSFNRDFVTYKYPLKMAFYADAIKSLHSDDYDLSVKIIAAQSKPTIDVGVYNVPDEVLNYGRSKYLEALEQHCYCVENNEWPGLMPYEEGVIKLPDWVHKGEVVEGFEWNE